MNSLKKCPILYEKNLIHYDLGPSQIDLHGKLELFMTFYCSILKSYQYEAGSFK